MDSTRQAEIVDSTRQTIAMSSSTPSPSPSPSPSSTPSPSPSPSPSSTPFPSPTPSPSSFLTPIISKFKSIPLFTLTIALLLLSALASLAAMDNAARVGAISVLFTASLAAVASEAILIYLSRRKFVFSQTALISGLILGSILDPSTPIWQAAALAILAMGVKRLVHAGPFPIFNPAAFALVIGGLLLNTQDVWWAYSLPCALAAILLISWRQNKWKMQLAFSVAWMAVTLVVSRPSGGLAFSFSSLSSLLLALPLYLMGFMLLEPKTSPARPTPQLLYGALVALVGVWALASPLATQVDGLLAALLFGNLLKFGLDRLKLGP